MMQRMAEVNNPAPKQRKYDTVLKKLLTLLTGSDNLASVGIRLPHRHVRTNS